MPRWNESLSYSISTVQPQVTFIIPKIARRATVSGSRDRKAEVSQRRRSGYRRKKKPGAGRPCRSRGRYTIERTDGGIVTDDRLAHAHKDESMQRRSFDFRF